MVKKKTMEEEVTKEVTTESIEEVKEEICKLRDLVTRVISPPSLTVTKEFKFCYAHQLPEYCGKCANLHGHNVKLEVEVEKSPNRKVYPSMVMDFTDLKSSVNPLVEMLDHKFINEVLPKEYLPSTVENLCRFFWDKLSYASPIGNSLVRIRIWETDTCYAEMKRSPLWAETGEKRGEKYEAKR